LNINIKARLAKESSDEANTSDFRVLCGRIDDHGRQSCGAVLGHLHNLSPNTPFNNWCFNLPSGWIEGDDRIWHLTTYANMRRKHDVRQATNAFVGSDRRTRAQDRLVQGTSTKNRRPESIVQLAPQVRPSFGGVSEVRIQSAGCTWPPCLVRCPQCNGANLVDMHLVEIAQLYSSKE